MKLIAPFRRPDSKEAGIEADGMAIGNYQFAQLK
jgi:hypothetical protein